MSGRLCDRTTGQCLSCVGNTTGDRCEECKGGFYRVGNTQDVMRCQGWLMKIIICMVIVCSVKC